MARYTDDFTLAGSGEFAPGTTAAAFPARVCRAVKIKARTGNTGRVAIGLASTVTLPDGTTDTVAGWELSQGEEMDLIVGLNGDLSSLYAIGANATDSVCYLLFT